MNISVKIQSIQTLPLADTEIMEISYEDKGYFLQPNGTILENLPEFLRVVLLSKPGPGSHIVTEVWLPRNWNHCFLGLGNGGLAGNISHGLLAEKIRESFVAAHTDMGTSNGRERGIGNPDVWKDFGWRATHMMTVLGKQIITAWYGQRILKSYFIGCSTGGQQALSVAQRFPEDYDGIIAGVPANNRTHLHTYFLWNHVHLRKPDGRVLFTGDEVEQITVSAVAYYQSLGYEEPFVSHPRANRQIIDGFLEFLSENYRFSPDQLAALDAIYTGPVNPRTGEQIYNGMPMGSEKFGCGILDCQAPEAPHYYPFIWTFGENYCPYDFNFDKDMDKVDELLSEDLNANSPDLDTFFARGGKLFMYSGSADPCVPFPDAMKYYQRLATRYANIHEHCRYFLIPGQDHGATFHRYGNALMNRKLPTVSNIDVLRKWCEEGIAPDCFDVITQSNNQNQITQIHPFATKKNPIYDYPACSDLYLSH